MSTEPKTCDTCTRPIEYRTKGGKPKCLLHWAIFWSGHGDPDCTDDLATQIANFLEAMMPPFGTRAAALAGLAEGFGFSPERAEREVADWEVEDAEYRRLTRSA